MNKDQENAHQVHTWFRDSAGDTESSFQGTVTMAIFGSAQYAWHPSSGGGRADPDGPPVQATLVGAASTAYMLPKASITVLRGNIGIAGAK